MDVRKNRGRNLFYYSWNEVEEILQKSPAVVVTAGSFEQHGLHLPMGTDSILTHAVAEALCERMDLYYYPCTTYGQVWSARDFPGTVSISENILGDYLAQVIRSVRRFSGAKIFLYSFHKGNTGTLRGMLRRLRDEEGWTDLYVLDQPDLEKEACRYLRTPVWKGIWHAGELETALMLHVAPELVDMGAATCEFPQVPSDYGLRPIPWREFLQSGAFGDSRAADREHGEVLFALWVRRLGEVIANVIHGG